MWSKRRGSYKCGQKDKDLINLAEKTMILQMWSKRQGSYKCGQKDKDLTNVVEKTRILQMWLKRRGQAGGKRDEVVHSLF